MDPNGIDPTILDPDQVDINNLPISSGVDPSLLVDPGSLITDPTESPYPVVFSDPGSNSGGSMTPSNGNSAAGGSGFGTFLGQLTGAFTKALTGVGAPNAAQVGRTATGTPCTLGTAGCAAVPVQSSNTTLLVLVALGALVVIVVLRKS